jgi:glycosyltransferase involved in cell wall biosynthesis
MPSGPATKLSVVIITLNEERNIGRCLASVKNVADEIIIVDSFSTDNTATIAASYGAKVIQQAFESYGKQKNFATQAAAYHWVLSLDADEALSQELQQSILDVKKQPEHNIYQMPRLTNYCGKWIKHCGWYPDKQIRLYDRTRSKWKEEKVHEYLQSNTPGETIATLKGDLLHYSFYTVSEHLKKIEKYSELAARAAVEQGKNASLLKIWGSPKWHFFTEYIIKAGFLDGFYGYTICKLSAYAAFIKYSKIRMYNLANG